jgi:hypothetical protein
MGGQLTIGPDSFLSGEFNGDGGKALVMAGNAFPLLIKRGTGRLQTAKS